MLSKICSVIEIQNIQIQLQCKFSKYNYKYNYSVFKKINYNYNYNYAKIVINYSITCVIDPNPDGIIVLRFFSKVTTLQFQMQIMK